MLLLATLLHGNVLASAGIRGPCNRTGDSEGGCRRPRPMRHAFTLALLHKHFYEYVQETSRALDGLIRELRKAEPAP